MFLRLEHKYLASIRLFDRKINNSLGGISTFPRVVLVDFWNILKCEYRRLESSFPRAAIQIGNAGNVIHDLRLLQT